jgi:uncharacterized membrane protein
MQNDTKLERYWWRIFEFGILVKFLNGLWETAAGISVFALGKSGVANLFEAMNQWKSDFRPPHALIDAGAQAVHGAATFVGLYFLIHGIVNIFLSVQLFRRQLWAYLATMAVTFLFITYQIHRIGRFHSKFLIALTIFDILFVVLTWHEYSYQRSRRAEPVHV